jgi:hypothetical protein
LESTHRLIYTYIHINYKEKSRCYICIYHLNNEK